MNLTFFKQNQNRLFQSRQTRKGDSYLFANNCWFDIELDDFVANCGAKEKTKQHKIPL